MSQSKLRAGDRIERAGEPVLELTVDGTWAPVCRVDDVAMVDHTYKSELCCGVCGGTAREVMKVA